MKFDRITVETDKLQGQPCIRGIRISVETVVRLVAAGWTFEQILETYDYLEREDIVQALEYAAASTQVHVYPLREQDDDDRAGERRQRPVEWSLTRYNSGLIRGRSLRGRRVEP